MTQVTRIFDLLDRYREKYPDQVVVAGKANGKWTTHNTKEFMGQIDALSRSLLDRAVSKGDKVAIMSANRPEWNVADYAVNQLGAALVPLYPTLSEKDLNFILSDAEVKLIFVGTAQLQEKVEKALSVNNINLPIFSFDKVGEKETIHDLIARGKELETDLAPYRDAVQPDDLLTLIYTSGTTGTPKGVFLSHKNVLSNVIDSHKLFPENYYKAISFLPLSHIFERMVVYMYFYLGISIYYAESMDTIVADINDVKPDGFTTVPRVLEKVYDKIVAKGKALSGIKKALFFWALALGHNFQEPRKNGWFYKFKLAIARKLIFSKWQDALGGNIKAIISGGAALQERLARIFWAADIPILEGYGLTETSPVIAVNSLSPTGLLFGSVGKPLDSVEVKIASDGEVLTKGPNVTKGYYKNEEATKEAFDEDGWFKTGDIGELTSEGFLRITDRKKEMFKTAGGKYVAPQVLENKLMESSLIGQVMVLGEGKKFPAALIVPSYDDLEGWAKIKGISFSSREDLLKNDQVIKKYNDILSESMKDFGHWEQVKKFVLLANEWTIDGGELTPKLSLKRKVILERHADDVGRIYAENAENSNQKKNEADDVHLV
ncbi:AMP-dependent synthetase/ligase [Olivibacter sitiensis]|uniref:AMP-dependent synthetase/ligase n=1 Tax=Olivibacter sitiensis TaxID=376470 RepID=UPI000405893B|nr:long-chain fatty acid--CoA ligase [Olivibacter sitiensis]